MTNLTDTRTSDVDTTLREKFYSKIAEFSGPEGSAIDPYPMQRIADWWLTQFHQLMNEKREAIEGKRKKIRKDMPRDAQRYWTIHNGVLDDVLSILKD